MDRWEYESTFQEHARRIEPSQAEVEAVARRARATVHRSRRQHRWGLGGLALLTAAALGFLFLPRVEPSPPAAGPTPLAATEWSETSPRSGVSLRYQGAGELLSEQHIAWQEGVLDVEVDPEAGIDFAVQTDEALVRVLGTRFEVDRDPYGTRVHVERGEVSVVCEGGAHHGLSAGEQVRCLRSAAAGLGLAMSLERDGVGTAERLEVVKQALSHSRNTPVVRHQLESLRIHLLDQAGQSDQARTMAEELLRHTEDADLRQLAARIALETGGCEEARPHLEALVQAPQVVARVQLADCVTEDAPERARVLLQEALEQAHAEDVPAEQLQAIKDRLSNLR